MAGRSVNWVQVVSSNIGALAHDHETNELHIQFKNGHHYVYAGVPRTLYHQALTAGSAGKFVNDQIKGKFEHKKR